MVAAAALVRGQRAPRHRVLPGGGHRTAATHGEAGPVPPAGACPPAAHPRQLPAPRGLLPAPHRRARGAAAPARARADRTRRPGTARRADAVRRPVRHPARRTAPGGPAHPGPHRRTALRPGPAPGDPRRAGTPDDDRRAVQLVDRLWRYVHPEAVAQDRARHQPRPRAAAGPGPGGLPPGARTDRMAAGGAGRRLVCARRAPAVRTGRFGRLGARAAGAGQGRGLHRRGPLAGAGHRRGAHRAGPRAAHGHPRAHPDQAAGRRHARATGGGHPGGARAAAVRARSALGVHRAGRPGRRGPYLDSPARPR